MKYVCVSCFALLFAVTSCRKDRSGFLAPLVDTVSAGGCLVQKLEDEFGAVTTYRYIQDSVLSEVVFLGEGDTTSLFLTPENPRQFLFEGTSTSPNITEVFKTRIYLNADGTIAKETPLWLNPDKVTYTEYPDSANVYTYNNANQLIRIRVSGETDAQTVDLSYDREGRIEKIASADDTGKQLYVYDHFTFNTHLKIDNLNMLSLPFGSYFSSFFIPGLRNAYVSGYRLADFNNLHDPFITKVINYTFTAGSLTGMETITASSGGKAVTKSKITLSCN
jgi:hypothetical protein